MTSCTADLLALSDLLTTEEEKAKQKEEGSLITAAAAAPAVVSPGDIGPKTVDKTDKNIAASKKKSNSNDIWDEQEVEEMNLLALVSDAADKRQVPKHEVCYKQKVGSHDVFFGFGDKDPSTMSCEELVVKVFLPGCKFETLQLDVAGNHFVVRSPKFKLGLVLPQYVDDKNGNAQWDAAKSILSVTLPIIRPEDFFHPSQPPLQQQ